MLTSKELFEQFARRRSDMQSLLQVSAPTQSHSVPVASKIHTCYELLSLWQASSLHAPALPSQPPPHKPSDAPDEASAEAVIRQMISMAKALFADPKEPGQSPESLGPAQRRPGTGGCPPEHRQPPTAKPWSQHRRFQTSLPQGFFRQTGPRTASTAESSQLAPRQAKTFYGKGSLSKRTRAEEPSDGKSRLASTATSLCGHRRWKWTSKRRNLQERQHYLRVLEEQARKRYGLTFESEAVPNIEEELPVFAEGPAQEEAGDSSVPLSLMHKISRMKLRLRRAQDP